MGQNRSAAVMQQRSEAPDSLDYFPTPPWVTRALIEYALIKALSIDPQILSAWDPACGEDYMTKPLSEYFGVANGSDIHQYGDNVLFDFLQKKASNNLPFGRPDLTWTNPPFKLAAEFVRQALEVSRLGCMMYVRAAFPESQGRYNDIFKDNPPTLICYFAERAILFKGRLLNPDVKYRKIKKDKETGDELVVFEKPSTATAYMAMFWIKNHDRLPPIWIPPCRKQMERHFDYPAPEQWAA